MKHYSTEDEEAEITSGPVSPNMLFIISSIGEHNHDFNVFVHDFNVF